MLNVRLRFLLLVGMLMAICAGAQTATQKKSATLSKPATAQKAAPAAGGEKLPAEATVDSFMKHMFGYDPNITWKVLDIKPAKAAGVADVTVLLKNQQGQAVQRFFVMPDEKWAIAGDIMPFGADPFARNRAELQARVNGVVRGPASAPVTIVEFSDLECPSCKAAQPTVDKLLQDVPGVHFIFQNFPLETLHPWALKAAKYADCVGREDPNAFWKFIESAYATQEQINPTNADEKLKILAGQAGANATQVAGCSTQPQTAERIKASQDLGKSLDVTGTPTLFINGREIKNVNGMPYEILKQMVEAPMNAAK
jgi:protein-disulfide isomerase